MMNELTAPPAPRPNSLVLLEPEKVRLEKDRPGWLLLVLTSEEAQEYRVKPVRTFPLTDPDHYISLLDDEENEIGVIEDPQKLEPESQGVLEGILEHTYFLPLVEKIKKITEDFGVYRWEVETNKGDRTFEVRGRDDVRFVAGGHVLVRDIDGNRYHIKGINRLDPESRALLDVLL
jgi:hypothetical protein